MNSLLRYLFLDLNSFFASCEQQEQPALRGKPVAVVPLLAETTCCLAASYTAKAFGIKTGTSVRDARARCPDIQFVLARHEVYIRYHHRILKAVDQCLPVDTVMSIDEMLCELTGSQRHLPKAIALAHDIKFRLRHDVGECMTASIGLATNRFLAKVGSDMQKPNGLTVLLPEDLPHALFRLELRDLVGIGPRMEARLHQQGIFTIKQLCQVSRATCRTLWGGIVGERYYDHLRGIETELPETHHGSLGHQHVLEPNLRTVEGAWDVAKKLLVKAAVRLRQEGSFTRRLAVFIRFLDGPTLGDEIKVDETQDTLTLLNTLKTLWPRWPTELKPLCVGVTCLNLVPANQHQLSLFTPPQREALGPAIDRMNAKYGKETVSLGALYKIPQAAPVRIPFNRVPDVSEF